MSPAQALSGQILTEQGFVSGRLLHTDRITAIEPGPAPAQFILPGFIDLHVHGGQGHDVMEGAASVQAMARFHARHGTTALLATTITAPRDALLSAARGIGAASATPSAGAACVLGLHLEGPFINKDALGAQPAFAVLPDLALAAELCALAPLKVATIAPECDAEGALLAFLTQQGVRVQIGHTRCTYAQARQALSRGMAGFTHLFNAMTPLHHRAAGAAGAALAHAAYAEIIPDLLHVEPGALRTALRCIPGLYGVTDAVAACGMADGTYRLGSHAIFKRGLEVRLADHSLAGSALTMDQALRNFLTLGLTLEQASARLSTIPADYLGLPDRGRLRVGHVADCVVVDAEGVLLAVVARGERVLVG